MPRNGRFQRLRATSTFAGSAHDRWRGATLAVVGVGMLGAHFAREAARSGAHCDLYDMGVGDQENLGNQPVEVGEPKAEVIGRLCNASRPGSASPRTGDVRHVGAAAFEHVSAIVDCTDDPALALPLTELSNGWGVPLVRVAVDGSGRQELGRVLISDGGRGEACQLCASSWSEVFDAGPRTPCFGPSRDPARTNAGSALAMSVTGLALLSVQRLVGGNRAAGLSGQEFLVDLDAPQILSMRLRRNEACLTGHRRFEPKRLARTAQDTTVGELMRIAQGVLSEKAALSGSRSSHPQHPVAVAFRNHPILLGLACEGCGAELVEPGTAWKPTPPCVDCGQPMSRRRDVALDALTEAQADALGVAGTSCAALGFPSRGALVSAHAPGHPPIQLLFA